MIRQLVTLITESPPARRSRIYPMIGCARYAEWVRMISWRNPRLRKCNPVHMKSLRGQSKKIVPFLFQTGIVGVSLIPVGGERVLSPCQRRKRVLPYPCGERKLSPCQRRKRLYPYPSGERGVCPWSTTEAGVSLVLTGGADEDVGLAGEWSRDAASVEVEVEIAVFV